MLSECVLRLVMLAKLVGPAYYRAAPGMPLLGAHTEARFWQLKMRFPKLDPVDRRILEALQENARITNVELSDEVRLSPSPCLARVRRLEEEGFISRYVTILDPESVGLRVSVFVQVRLEKQIEASLVAFEKAVAACPEVMECYLMTGSSDYLLRVVVLQISREFQTFVTVLSRSLASATSKLRASR